MPHDYFRTDNLEGKDSSRVLKWEKNHLSQHWISMLCNVGRHTLQMLTAARWLVLTARRSVPATFFNSVRLGRVWMTDHKSMWHGDELFSRPDWEYRLTAHDIDELQTALATVTEIATGDISRDSFALDRLGDQLLKIQDSLETQSGITIVRGFPIDRFTPGQTKRIFFGMMQHIGTPISQSASGELVLDVKDAGHADGDAKVRGPNTRKRLSFHTDRCDVIGFLCVCPAKSGGENFVVNSRAVYDAIQSERPDLLEILMQPFYYKRHTVDLANQLAYCQQPIFSFEEGHFACSFLRVLIERAYASDDTPQMTDVQREALDFLESVAERPDLHVRFFQERGDIVLLNNWTTLHRRSEFEDHADPELKRHLLRVWLSVPNSRPIDPLFKANFGATEAGAIRGGMRAG